MSHGAYRAVVASTGMMCGKARALTIAVFVVVVMTGATAGGAAANPRVKQRSGAVTACIEPSGQIAPVCAEAVSRARAVVNRTRSTSWSMPPVTWQSSTELAPSYSATPAVESPGGDTLEVKEAGDGTTQESAFAHSYNNGESTIYCDEDPALGSKELYGACAHMILKDAVTGEKAPAEDESTDTEFDACGKLASSSHVEHWFTNTSKTEVTSGWLGGRDQITPETDRTLCAGVWTVVYSYTQTFTNHEKLTAETSGTFVVNLAPGLTTTEQYAETNPATPNYTRACEGKPVNCATGNETVSHADLHVGGRGIPLSFARTYNSQAAANASTPGLLGYGWSTSYSDHLEINSSYVTVVQANGSTARFETTGKPGTLTAQQWLQASLVLNEDGTYTYTLPTRETFHFAAGGELLSEADRNGNVTMLNHNAEGRLESVTDPAGRRLTFSYNAEGLIEAAQDPMGHAVHYSYEGGALVSVTLPGEATPWHFKYNSAHRLTQMVDPRGGVTEIFYDLAGRVESEKDPMGRILKWEYGETEAHTPKTVISNSATGAMTQEIFSYGDEPLEITRGYGTSSAITERFRYNGEGAMTEQADGKNHVTLFGYDNSGNRTSMTDPDKDVRHWEYDGTHDVIAMTMPNGETTTIKRDSKGNVESEERQAPGGQVEITRYKYNPLGEVEAVTDPMERTTTYQYDNEGDRTAETDAEGDKRTWEYNEDSQETATVSPRGNLAGGEPAKYTTATTRDAQGRAVTVTDPLGHETKYAFDPDGNVESTTDGRDLTTRYTYDADNELIKVEQPNGAIAETAYDGAGNVISQTDANKHTTKYVRNVLGRVTEVVDPLARKTLKEYDAAGNLTKVTDPLGRVSTRSYDAANRLKEIVYVSGRTEAKVQYEYDVDGNRTKMVDATGSSSFSYDPLDRLTEATDGHGDTVKYEYDLGNELTKIIYPNGKGVTRAFDRAGRLQKVTDWLEHTTSFGYNSDSRLTTTTWPAGTGGEDIFSYNEADQLSEVKMAHGTETLAALGYTVDADGQIKTVSSKGLPGEEGLTYEYDPNNRLIRGGGVAYEYDAAGNPTRTGASINTFDEADELKSGTNVTYTYDAAGERTKSTPTTGVTMTYGYDLAGNLTTAEGKESKHGGFTETYTYDGDALRTAQTVNGVQSFLTWQTTTSVPLLLSDGANSYIYGPEAVPIEEINSQEEPTYLHHDQQGSTRLLTSATGTVTGTYTYTPYGAIEGHTGSATSPLGYDGQLTSSHAGLIYLRKRVYDPATAQFLTGDPLEQVTRVPYAYVEDNPINAVDPTGLCGTSSFSDFADCFNPVSSGNIAYKGAVALKNETGIDLPGLLTKPALVDLGAAGVCVTPALDAACPGALGAAWSVSTSSVVATAIDTNFCNPEKLVAEETVTTLVAGFGALGVYTSRAAAAQDAPWYARAIIRGGPAALEALLNGPAAANGG